MSDHYGTLSKIEGISQENGRRDIYYRKSKLSDEKWEEFNADFQDSVRKNVPFPHLLNANSLAAAIKDAYQSTIDKFMPLKKRSIIVKNEPDRPWITSGFKVSIDHMYELLRTSKTSQSLEDYEKYKNYRNKLTHLKSKAKDKYYRDKSELYGRDISKTWQLINEISNYKRKTKTSIKSIVDKDGNTLSDHISIADCFNNHFSSVGSVMAQKFDGIDSSRVKNPMSYLSNDVKNSLFLSLPTAHEIAKIIRKLNVKKSFGYDLISNKIVQVTNETISSYLEVLFHKCLKEGVFPDSFKIAQVIPLFKGGDRQDLNC